MILWEIFNSKLDLHWENKGRFKLAQFTFDSYPFIIQIEDKKTGINILDNYVSAEVSFFRNMQDGELAFSTINDIESIPVKVYGVVANALTDQFKNYDIFYFSIEKRHSLSEKDYQQKQSIYELIANRIAKQFPHTKVYKLKSGNKLEYLLSRVPVNKNTGYENDLEEALASSDFKIAKI